MMLSAFSHALAPSSVCSFVRPNPHIHSVSFGRLVLLAQLSIDANLSLLYKDVERMCMRIGIALELAEWGECGRKDGKYDRRRRQSDDYTNYLRMYLRVDIS